jgi:hypothetical protein
VATNVCRSRTAGSTDRERLLKKGETVADTRTAGVANLTYRRRRTPEVALSDWPNVVDF